MIARRTLTPRIEIEADWTETDRTETGKVARPLLERSFMGKAVLHLN